jgi:HEAT repeat protein
VWGGLADAAIDVRCSCAMGLVATGYFRAVQELTALLNDPEWRARAGAARAISCGNPREAEALLRFKVLVGDPEPEAIGECS